MSIDRRFVDSLMLYRNNRINPGQFLISLLENDAFTAIGRADDGAREQLGDITRWIVMNLPPLSWGGRERVSDWLAWKDKRR